MTPTTQPAPTAAQQPPPAVTPAAPTRPAWTPPPDDPPRGTPIAAAGPEPERCTIRLAGSRILVDGDDATRAQAVAICRQRKAALIELGDSHDAATWAALRTALVAARVPLLMRGRQAEHDCQNTPLARGCL